MLWSTLSENLIDYHQYFLITSLAIRITINFHHFWYCIEETYRSVVWCFRFIAVFADWWHLSQLPEGEKLVVLARVLNSMSEELMSEEARFFKITFITFSTTLTSFASSFLKTVFNFLLAEMYTIDWLWLLCFFCIFEGRLNWIFSRLRISGSNELSSSWIKSFTTLSCFKTFSLTWVPGLPD